MKYRNIYFVLLVAIVAGTACKKSNGNGNNNGQTEKKAVVSTIAGDGTDAFADGAALSAKFHVPIDVAVATDGTIYVADYLNRRIRKITGGQVSTYAGTGGIGIVNDIGTAALFRNPFRIAVDGNGNVYVLDEADPRIRKIATDTHVTTYAGTDQPGFLNDASLQAQFQINAGGLATDAQGNVYIDDTFNERIRKISLAAQVSTFAGSGAEGFLDGDPGVAKFMFPDGITIDQQGNMYVADAGNFCIRKITPVGVVSRLAGTGARGMVDGNANTAQFYSLGDIVADNAGNIYVTDDQRIRKITPQGVVSTIAGSTAGFAEGDGAQAKFHDPLGLGIDAQGNIYVADCNNHSIRKIIFQ